MLLILYEHLPCHFGLQLQHVEFEVIKSCNSVYRFHPGTVQYNCKRVASSFNAPLGRRPWCTHGAMSCLNKYSGHVNFPCSGIHHGVVWPYWPGRLARKDCHFKSYQCSERQSSAHSKHVMIMAASVELLQTYKLPHHAPQITFEALLCKACFIFHPAGTMTMLPKSARAHHIMLLALAMRCSSTTNPLETLSGCSCIWLVIAYRLRLVLCIHVM